VTEWNTGSRSMSPGPSAQMGMRLARLRQAGAHHGSRASAALGIQEQSLTLSVIIRYSPMQKQSGCTRKNIRSVMNSPIHQWTTTQLKLCISEFPFINDQMPNAGGAKRKYWNNSSLTLVCALFPFQIKWWCSETCHRLHAWMVNIILCGLHRISLLSKFRRMKIKVFFERKGRSSAAQLSIGKRVFYVHMAPIGPITPVLRPKLIHPSHRQFFHPAKENKRSH
jgi:hypothetical protein